MTTDFVRPSKWQVLLDVSRSAWVAGEYFSSLKITADASGESSSRSLFALLEWCSAYATLYSSPCHVCNCITKLEVDSSAADVSICASATISNSSDMKLKLPTLRGLAAPYLPFHISCFQQQTTFSAVE